MTAVRERARDADVPCAAPTIARLSKKVATAAATAPPGTSLPFTCNRSQVHGLMWLQESTQMQSREDTPLVFHPCMNQQFAGQHPQQEIRDGQQPGQPACFETPAFEALPVSLDGGTWDCRVCRRPQGAYNIEVTSVCTAFSSCTQALKSWLKLSCS